MNDNGMGGRRIGKKYHVSRQDYRSPDGIDRHSGRNFEEDTNWFSYNTDNSRLSDWDKLLADYQRDKKYIKSQKRKWLPPKSKEKR